MKKTLALFLAFVMLFATCGTAFAVRGDWSAPDKAEILADSMAAGLTMAEEGMILLRNENDSLPLAEGVKVNVFGASAEDPFYGGGGSGAVTVTSGMNFYTALETAGIEYNEELKATYNAWYAEFEEETTYPGQGVGIDGMQMSSVMNAEWDIMNDKYDVDGNLRVPKMDAAVLENAEAYSDTAIVYIARSGSEGSDLNYTDLELSEPEASTLQYVTSTYENVIIVFNILNAMEMGWLEGYEVNPEASTFTYDAYKYGTGGGCWGGGTVYTVEYDEPHTYQIGASDSAIITWAPGESGIDAVGEIISGAVNPSGRTVDTYAYDHSTNPTYYNLGSWEFGETGEVFNVYEESIYVGYLYYETFDPEAVQYPFGYGLSYTTFEWSDFETALGENEYGEETIEVSVTVTNTGDVAGKDVVELYYSAPYYNDSQYDDVEKALVKLGAFDKTEELEPGESEEMTLVLNVRDMASWSSDAKAYVLEYGNYAVTVATNANTAHTAPAYTFNYNVAETVEYKYDEVTGYAYDTLFEEAEGIGEVTQGYMHRVDINGVPTVQEGTFPESPDGTEYIDFAMRQEKYGQTYYKDYSNLDVPDWSDVERTNLEDAEEQNVVYYDEDGNVDVYTMQEVYYDLQAEGADSEAIWDKFLDQLNIYDMIWLTSAGSYRTPGLEQFGIATIADQDGPACIKYAQRAEENAPEDAVTGGWGCAYPVYSCVAASWNTDISKLYGERISVDGHAIGTYGWYAPAVNIHRAPVSGRNFEYCSEDGYLSGAMVIDCIKSVQANGILPYLKHFAVNDQEQDRMSICTFADEQAIREIYLNAFEVGIKGSDCLGVMSSYNRVGIEWTGGDVDMMTNVLRNEWGFKGAIVSDYGMFGQNWYQNHVLALLAGQDLELTGSGYNTFSSPTATSMAYLASSTLEYYEEVDPVGILDAARGAVRRLCENRGFHSYGFLQTLAEDWEWSGAYENNTYYSLIDIADATAGISSADETATIEIPVSIEGNEGLTAMKLTFSGIDFTGAEVVANYGDVEYNNNGEDLILEWWEISGSMTDDVLFTIELPYSAANVLANGTYRITAVAEDVIDRIEHEDDVRISSGTLTVANEYPAGDVTGDFEITNADIITIARYLVDLYAEGSAEAIAVETYGDINADGSVTNVDLIKLARALVEA